MVHLPTHLWPTVNVYTVIVYTIDTIINRRYREERERLVDAMVAEMLLEKPGPRENINSEHRFKMLLNQFTVSTAREQEYLFSGTTNLSTGLVRG